MSYDTIRMSDPELYGAMKKLTPSQFKNIQEIIYDLTNCK